MTIENPKQLWAFTVRGDVRAALAEAPLLSSWHHGWGWTTETDALRRERDAIGAALAHVAERCAATTDALVMARIETAKSLGRTERAIVAGESLLVQLTEAKERAAEAEGHLALAVKLNAVYSA